MAKKKTCHQLHHEAMEYADKAHLGLRGFRGKKITQKEANVFFKKAFELEKKSAMMLMDYPVKKVEPTRSVLFRSAGWLAHNAGMYIEAKEMAELGLKYVIHDDIKEELNDLLSEIKNKLKTKKS